MVSYNQCKRKIMTTEIATTKSFQDRMFERIRDQMGDLMTNDDLKKIVEAAMQKAFFEERVDRSSYNPVTHPSLFVVMLQNLLKEQMKDAVQQWLADHSEEVSKAINETLSKGITKIMQDHIDSKAQQPLFNLYGELTRKGVLS